MSWENPESNPPESNTPEFNAQDAESRKDELTNEVSDVNPNSMHENMLQENLGEETGEYENEQNRLKDSLLQKIDKQQIAEAAKQELERKGLFEQDKDGGFLVHDRDILLEMAETRVLEEAFKKLSEEVTDSAEKARALELANERLGRMDYLQDQYLQKGHQSDMRHEIRTGQHTASGRIQSLENLRRFEMIGQEEFEMLKADLS